LSAIKNNRELDHLLKDDEIDKLLYNKYCDKDLFIKYFNKDSKELFKEIFHLYYGIRGFTINF